MFTISLHQDIYMRSNKKKSILMVMEVLILVMIGARIMIPGDMMMIMDLVMAAMMIMIGHMMMMIMQGTLARIL
ncbi:hypothetical protein A6D96_06180 [Vibrio cyclitrophicus]|nr:hypothetical protein A6D96_06180 [Vibrio cyclitrophicus]